MRFPSFVTKVATSILDVEKGHNMRHGAQAFSNDPQDAQSGSLATKRNPESRDALTQFRYYIGIHNDPELEAYRPVPNLGIYQRLVKAEKLYKQQYKLFSWIINGALGLQIVFAAALTALGAGDGPRSAVTAFGALNTILAGVLTFLRGSGLPNRMKYYQNELTKVREYIEQREREFARGDAEIDYRAEVAVIEDMYEAVKRDIELNTPDAYVSTTRDSRRMPSLGRHVSLQRDLDDRGRDLDEKYQSTRSGLESRLSQAKLGFESRLAGTRQEVEDQIRQTRGDVDNKISGTRNDIQSRLSQERLGMENRVASMKKGFDDQVQESQGRMDDHINTAKLATAAQVEETRHGFESRLDETRSGLASQVEDSRHGMESRLKEVQTQVQEHENKILNMVEKVAEKVLATTQQRREHDKT